MNEQKQVGQLHAVVIQNLPELTSVQRQVGIRDPMRVQKYLAGLADVLRDTFSLTAKIDRDMTGWKCVESVPAEEGEFELVVQEFLRGDETYLGGEEMVKRGKKQGANTGLRHLEAMLREQDKIPAELRQFCLVSTEVWLSPSGGRRVFCLRWVGLRWVLGCLWLQLDFRSDDRFVGSRKYQK